MIIEIIPNWHPLFVHFTVGLLSTSVLFYLASAFLSKENSWKQQWLTMANWSLWSGCLFAIGTAIAGWFAYNSVAHDSASHAAMTLHRNWALPTAGTFLLLGFWAIMLARKKYQPSFIFLTFSIIAAGLLMITGWLGAEAVYRYGLGVQSLPNVEAGVDGHNHSHGDVKEHDEPIEMDNAKNQPLKEDTHQHDHEKMETSSKTEPSASSVEEKTDGHNHSHEIKNSESTEKDTQKEISQPLKEDTHQHNHEKMETPSKTEPSNEKVHSHTH